MIYSYLTIIVGAGLTGLSTAALFEKNHKDYFLIEKDTEIGGKIKSSAPAYSGTSDNSIEIRTLLPDDLIFPVTT